MKKKRLKILLIETNPFPYTIGGTYSYLCTLSKELIKKGYEIHILSSKPNKIYKQLNYPQDCIIHHVGLLKHKRFEKGNKMLAYLRRIIFEFSFINGVRKKIKEINPDIINPQSPITPSLGCALSKRDFIITCHGIFLSGFEELWKRKGRKDVKLTSKFYKFLEKYNLKRCNETIGVSQGVVDHYSQFIKSTLIENSIDIEPFNKIDVERKKNRFLFLGRLSPEKGLDYLLDALRILDKVLDKDIEFIIAGAGDEAYIDSLKQKSKDFTHIMVKYPGPLYDEAKIKLYKSSSIFVLPSLFESFGIVLLEAMAAGCGIIASNCSGPKEIVKDEFGILVDYTNEEDRVKNLAAALQSSLNWNGSQGLAARNEVKKYDSKIAINKYLKIYERLK